MLPTVLVLHANDANQHLGILLDMLERFRTSGRISTYHKYSATGVESTDLRSLRKNDLVILLLTDAMRGNMAYWEHLLTNRGITNPELHLVAILIDEVPYPKGFTILPVDLIAIREQKDMDACWQYIEAYLKEVFPPAKKKELKAKYFKKFWPHALAVFALILLFIFLFRPDIPKNVTMENFSDKFGFDEKAQEWLGAFSATKEQLVLFYQKNESKRAKEFTEFAVETLTKDHDDSRIDMNEIYIETETSDKGAVTSAALQFFPKPNLISKAPPVLIRFGTTHSDNKNSDQKVARELIDGITYAVEVANTKLETQKRIKSIYIMATTNGTHGPQSNHYTGTAIDISRLNDIRMVLMEETELEAVYQLQKAFNSYPYVRENFGPSLKHKYSIESNDWDYNYPVNGHIDHIHLSVRKLPGFSFMKEKTSY